MGGKKRENFFPETRISRPKNDGKKSSVKSAKTRFLLKHEYRDQKMGKKREKNFFRKHMKRVTKNVGKIWSQKSAKTRFL